MANGVNSTRHREYMDPAKLGSLRLDVIGAGALGSRLAIELARLGVNQLHVWDFDRVEEHNIANQFYTKKQIGQFKVDALAQIIKETTDLDIVPHKDRVTRGCRVPGKVAFLMVDRMDTRRDIVDTVFKGNATTSVLVEARIGIDSGSIYTINPNAPSDVRFWHSKSAYADPEVDLTQSCGNTITIGATAGVISSACVFQFMMWARNTYHGEKATIEKEITVSMHSLGF